ncbi:MAG: hypothetical protein HYY52_07070 [Candidatus Melainabacteria bacterium]|nr:hypothetical protein [Candidatus Melainabacteria bacterium]
MKTQQVQPKLTGIVIPREQEASLGIYDAVYKKIGGQTRLPSLKIFVTDSGYKLTGSSPTYYLKQLAQVALCNLFPAEFIRNDIKVV